MNFQKFAKRGAKFNLNSQFENKFEIINKCYSVYKIAFFSKSLLFLRVYYKKNTQN